MTAQKTSTANKRTVAAEKIAEATMQKAKRSQTAMKSRVHGAQFEKMVDVSLEWYRAKGEAFISKTPEPMKPIRATGRGGQFIACYTKTAQPDYKGTISGGRAIVFDAKHCEKSEKIDYSRVTPEQREELEAHYKLGAAAGVLVSFAMTDFYWVPWAVWRDMQAIYGHKHMKKHELEPFRVPCINGVIKLLDGIEKEETC